MFSNRTRIVAAFSFSFAILTGCQSKAPVEVARASPIVEPTPTETSAPSPPVSAASEAVPAMPPVASPVVKAMEPQKTQTPDPFLTEIEALRDRGQHSEALPKMEGWMKTHPDHVPAMVLRGRLLQELRRLPEAEEELSKAVRLDPKYSRSYETRFYTRAYSNNLPGALEDTRMWSSLSPTDPWAHMQAGCMQCKLGMIEDSLASFDAALKIYPKHRASLEWRARARFVLNRFELALADVEAATELKSQDLILHGIRGTCLVKLNRPKEALPALNEAIRLAPREASWYSDRAEAHEKIGNAALAAQDRRSASDLSPRALPEVPGGGSAGRLADAAHYDALQRSRDQAVRTNLQNSGRLAAMGLR